MNDRTVINSPPISVTAHSGMLSQNPTLLMASINSCGSVTLLMPELPDWVIMVDTMLNGYKLIIGALCVLLAFIGIANVFSNTLGFIRQRKREFARYMSIGMTPEGMRKMFWIEALVIAGRPVLITLPITVVFVWLMITASYLNPMEFLAVAPIVPILLFIVALFGFVALAYYLGGKKILKCDLVEALRTDYMG